MSRKRTFIGGERRRARGIVGQESPPPPVENGVVVNTPISPQATGIEIVVTGTYTGQPSSISVVWRQGGSNVGSPVNASTIAAGAWSATITTPASAGTYTLRAAFNGSTPTAVTNDVTIEEPGAAADVANILIEGTGLGADHVGLLGQAFPEGVLDPLDLTVVRDENNTLLRTQTDVLSTWSDGSVKHAAIAVECPALGDQVFLNATFRKNESHGSPGANLAWASALSGRTIEIKTWAPGDTTSPLWTYDVKAALAGSYYRQGPLLISERVETLVPSSAVYDIQEQSGTVESVRLLVDVEYTKDTMLDVDVCFANDLLEFDSVNRTGGGYRLCDVAFFGYTIEIDGVIVYDQRTPKGTKNILRRYTRWLKRRGKKAGSATVYGWSNFRPFVWHDKQLIDASNVHTPTLDYRPLSASEYTNTITNLYNAGTSQETNPYYPHGGIKKLSGLAGGRPELGFRPASHITWYSYRDRTARLLAERMAEVGATRSNFYWDLEDETWVNPPGWPQFTTGKDGGDATLYASSVAGTPKTTAQGLVRQEHPYHGYMPVAATTGTITMPGSISDGTRSRGISRIIGNGGVGSVIRFSHEGSGIMALSPGQQVTGPGGVTITIGDWVTNHVIDSPASDGFLGVDHAHYPSYYAVPALLTARRHWFDCMAARSLSCTTDSNNRWSNSAFLSKSGLWRTLTPSYTTGIAWGPELGYDQTRAQTLDYRCIIDAAIMLPDDHPQKTLCDQNLQAWVNAQTSERTKVAEFFGHDLFGSPFVESGPSEKVTGYQWNFGGWNFPTALRAGVGGANMANLVDAWAQCRTAWYPDAVVETPTFNYRNFMSGSGWFFGDTNYATTKAADFGDVQTLTAAEGLDIPADWTEPIVHNYTGSYHREGVAALARIAYAAEGLSLTTRANAADACVLCHSERQHPEGSLGKSDPMPRTWYPQYFISFFQFCAGWPNDITPDTTTAPIITAGQTFTVPDGAENGDVVGIIAFTGSLPRNSAEKPGVDDAFVITEQPAGNPFSVSQGGVIRVANAAALPVSADTITVKARTYEQRRTTDTNILHDGTPVIININPASVVTPIIAAAGPFTVPVNAALGTVVHTVTFSNTPSPSPTVSEAGGDPSNYFITDNATRQIRVNADLSAVTPDTEVSYQVEATNSGGSDTETFTITIVAVASPPAIANQTVVIEESAEVSDDVTITNTGGAATSLTITGSTPSGAPFVGVAPNIIRRNGITARAERTSWSLDISASNSGGSDTATITMNVTQADWVYSIPNTIVLEARSYARRLRNDYAGSLVRAIRVADSAETDIGQVDSGGGVYVLDVAALEDFAQGGRVVGWPYDQGPFEQPNPNAHSGGYPYLTDASGNAIEIGTNNRAGAEFTGARGLIVPSFKTGGNSQFGIMMAVERNFIDTSQRILATLATASNANPTVSNTSFLMRYLNTNRLQLYRNGTGTVAQTSTNVFNNTTPYIVGGYTLADTGYRRALSVGSTFYQATDSGTWSALNSTAQFTIGCRTDSANVDWVGPIGEWIVFSAFDLGSDQGAIRSNMGTYFGV